MKPDQSIPTVRILRAMACLSMLVLSACEERNQYVKPPPPKVEVVQPIIGTVNVPKDAPGTTVAFEVAEIRARVQGFLEAPKFKAGHFVKKGQELFQIEREEFEARLKAAQGELDAAKAQEGIAKSSYDKRFSASKSGAVSKIDVEAAKAEWDAAKASVSIQEAKKEDAERALKYSTVVAPIDGIVSRTLVDVGNLVGADGPTLLTTIVRQDPIYVDFEANEREAIDKLSLRPGADREGYDDEFKKIEAQLLLSDGSTYPLKGKLDSVDNRIDPTTGTIRIRARFDNPDGKLASGMFVRVQLEEEIEGAIKVPDTAVQRDLGGSYVVVVDAEGVAQRKQVARSPYSDGDLVILTSGLSAQDRVIVSNLQRARPGSEVEVVVAAPNAKDQTQADPAAEKPDSPDAAMPAPVEPASPENK